MYPEILESLVNEPFKLPHFSLRHRGSGIELRLGFREFRVQGCAFQL